MLRLPYGLLKNIKKQTGIKTQELSDYAGTRKRPGRLRAKVLEDVTGVTACIWLFGSSEEIKRELIRMNQLDY
jgi:hypothetical protein